MNDKNYNKPNITINKVYTKVGDKGETNIVGGHKINKDSMRIKSFGNVDELIASIGSCNILIKQLGSSDDYEKLSNYLQRILHELFNLGNMIATLSVDYKENMPAISSEDISCMENKIDYYNSFLPRLKSFVLPGGSEIEVRFHIARTICRRCERKVVELNKNEDVDNIVLAYLNRLSDLLFVLSRWSNYISATKEFIWNPNYKD